MLPPLIPPLVVAGFWFAGGLDWTWLRFQLRWDEPIINSYTAMSLAAAWAFLGYLGLLSFGDRSPRGRVVLAAAIGFVLGTVAVASSFVIAVWLAGG